MKPDTKTHLLGGLVVLLVAACLAAVLLALGAHPLTATVAIAGLVAGAAVEGTQANDNRLARAQGLPKPHEVSLRDLVNSGLPCWIAAVLIEWSARADLLHWPSA